MNGQTRAEQRGKAGHMAGWNEWNGSISPIRVAGRLPKQKSYTLNFISNFCVIILTTNDVRKILLYITTALWVE